ncbi:MAG: hypothetical protein II279_04680 [Bacteroidaceae bacterium]|jgi:sugar/nucleoside kinase (ribokinase family)|nr:hypothetical protein [Bacteroidaceae bacterium]
MEKIIGIGNTIVDILARLEGNKMPCQKQLPKGQKTLNDASKVQISDITPALFEDVTMVHIEGTLAKNHDLVEAICQTAMEQSVQISLDLADKNIVAANLPFFQHLVQDCVDVVIANEEEAKAFTGKEDALDALRAIAAYKCLAVVKLGSKGACTRLGAEEVMLKAQDVSVVDTTAAGIFFDAGFLYALDRGASLKDCLSLGTCLAEHIVGVAGTQLSDEVWQEIRKKC